jgi:hypothetical protein
MQLGAVAVLISLVVALYAAIIMLVLTRALYRCVLDKPSRPIRLEVAFKDLDALMDKKKV